MFLDSHTRLGLELVGVAVALGILGDHLLRVGPWGLNAFIWISCLVATSYGLLHRWHSNHTPTQQWFILPLSGLALLYLGRDAATLKLINAVALLAALGLGVWHMQMTHLRRHPSVPVEPPGLLLSGFRALFSVPRFVVRGIDWKSLKANGRDKKIAAVARGLLIALPVLILFGTLLAAADAVFENLMSSLFELDPATLPSHLVLTLLFSWIVSGFLYGLLISKKDELYETDETLDAQHLDTTSRFSLGIVEVGIVLGLINALFATFVVVQLSYFFGGHTTVLTTTGLTLAHYARSGFFELVVVASLALPLLLGLRRLLKVKAGRSLRTFHTLTSIQIALLFLMLASAAQRMWLYQQVYGLTELRLYVSAFIVWLAFVLGWFLFNMLREQIERFMPGAIAAGFVLVFSLHVLNPDALIVRTNVARSAAGAPIDTTYLAHLSADAVPALLHALPTLPVDTQATLAKQLLARWSVPPSLDWRTWSRARAQAWHIVALEKIRLQHLSHATNSQHPHQLLDTNERPELSSPLAQGASE